MLTTKDLHKSFKGRPVINGISLSLKPGRTIGLLGPNGAGKTTTFYMMVGLLKPDRGQVMLGDKDITHLPIYARARLGLGYLPQEPSVFRKLSVEQNLFLILDNMKISRKEKRSLANRMLVELGIESLAQQRAYTLSGGERRRLEIARALLLSPTFLLLDEPYAGIDPVAVEDIQRILLQLKERGIGVIITDHNVRETLRTCDEVYLIRDGVIWLGGTPQEIVENDAARRFYLGEGFRL